MKKNEFATRPYAENTITSTGTSYSAVGSWDEMRKEVAELKERVSVLENPNKEQKIQSKIEYPTQDKFRSAAKSLIGWGSRFKVIFTYSATFGDIRWDIVPSAYKLNEWDIAEFSGDWEHGADELEIHMKKEIMKKVSEASK